MEVNDIPEWMIAKFSIAYDTESIVQDLKDAGIGEPTVEDIVKYIDEHLHEHFTPEQIKWVDIADDYGKEY